MATKKKEKRVHFNPTKTCSQDSLNMLFYTLQLLLKGVVLFLSVLAGEGRCTTWTVVSFWALLYLLIIKNKVSRELHLNTLMLMHRLMGTK